MEENKITTRLIITKMILENFKSYAGKQEIGPFHKRFSSIVGPNGSGKSNVIDALLFVFGKRAKQLRLSKVSELIHKSMNYPSLEYAKVEVYFQLINDNENSEDDYEIIPNSEFIVSRTAFKNNQSKYTIDGKNSTYTEVGTVLRSYGIDLDNNRFLILQGEVEQIAMMKPKSQPPNEDGLLEYLEDIIGSNKYVPQIEEASKNVEQLNELRVERVKRLQISQTDRESLERPRTEAQAYLEREANIRLKNNILYQIYLHDCDQNIEELSTKLQGYHQRLKEEKIKLTETEKTLKILDKNYQHILLEYDRLTSEMQKTVDDFTAYERRDTKMIEDMKYTKSEIQKLEASIKKETTKEKEAISSIEKYEQEITNLRNDLVSIQTRKEAAEKHLDEVMGSLQESTAHLRVELETAQAELTESDRRVSELQTEKENIETAINLVESRSISAKKAFELSETKLTSLINEENDITSGRSTIQSRKINLTQRLNTLTENLTNLRQKQTDLQSRVRQAVSTSEESKAAMQSQQSSSGVVRSEIASILKQTKPGGCLSKVGVRGRLGDLGTISNEYDTAISTACGCLDYIVVDSGDAANACIAYLRETNSGRASFIVLDQLGHSTSKMDANLHIPNGTQRLFDLIHPKDPIYRPAFYMALRDTLVTDDWDLATRVAYEGDRVKWRIVTTSGNLIDTSGSMTGGGKPPSNGGMKAQSAKDEVKITPEQIEALDAEVERLQNELSKCRNDISNTEKEITEVEKELKKIQIEVDKTELQLSRIISERQDINSRLSTIQNACSLTSEEISEKNSLERKLTKLCRKIDEASPNRTQIQANVKEIQQRILDVGGPGLKRAQSKVDSATSEYSACQSSISAKEVALATAMKQKTKASNTKNKAENDLENAIDKKSKLEEEHQQMESEAVVVLKAQELAKQAALAKEKELNEFTEEYKRLQDTIRVIKEVEIDLRSNFDNCNKLLTENQSKRAGVLKELTKVRKQHDEDMREFGIFFDTQTHDKVDGCGEETKGEFDLDIENISKVEKPLSSVLQIMKDFSSTELSELLGISSFEPTPTTIVTETKTVQPKKGKGRKQAEPIQEEIEEETKVLDDPKRNAIESLKREINLMEADRDRLKTAVNMTSLLEYKKKDEEFRARLVELEDVTTQRNNSRKEYEELRRKRLEEFMSGFGIITLKLKEMYQMITLGGDAELELVDSLDPFSEGIVFSVRPPKKSWKNISNLSGGEKTLSSLALVFALHHFKPTPLYVMDEIDAALDFKNVSIVANYIKQRTKNAQFVIISLRNNMFELANRLVGIYKTNDTTKSVTINPHCFESVIQSSNNTTQTIQQPNTVNLKDDKNNETDTNDISPSPMMKKGRSSKKNYSIGEENENNSIKLTQKVLNYENERKNILSDSTNKL